MPFLLDLFCKNTPNPKKESFLIIEGVNMYKSLFTWLSIWYKKVVFKFSNNRLHIVDLDYKSFVFIINGKTSLGNKIEGDIKDYCVMFDTRHLQTMAKLIRHDSKLKISYNDNVFVFSIDNNNLSIDVEDVTFENEPNITADVVVSVNSKQLIKYVYPFDKVGSEV